jgi:hypothetical protein
VEEKRREWVEKRRRERIERKMKIWEEQRKREEEMCLCVLILGILVF